MQEEQKYEPEYKDKKFNSEKAFDRWLKAKAVKKICFQDTGQDCLEWWIDKGGEVIHSYLQPSVWNGMVVDKHNLEIGKQIGVMDIDNMRTVFYDFIVEKIIDLKGTKNERTT